MFSCTCKGIGLLIVAISWLLIVAISWTATISRFLNWNKPSFGLSHIRLLYMRHGNHIDHSSQLFNKKQTN